MGGISLPSIGDVPWLIGLAASATLAHWVPARALALADASLIILDFTKLPWVTLGAFVSFEVPVVWAWIGGAVIFVATLYIVRQNSRCEDCRPDARLTPQTDTNDGRPPHRLINRPITRFSPPAGYWERLLPSF